jgi:hypothetical protein
MTFTRHAAAAVALFVATAIFAAAYAHQSTVVGEGDDQYRITVGMLREPAFTDERNGLDLIVRTLDGAPVTGLAESLMAEITAPTGAVRTLALRAQWGRDGHYTDDIVLTFPGVYRIRVWGFIDALEIDERFETHEVRPLADLAFP